MTNPLPLPELSSLLRYLLGCCLLLSAVTAAQPTGEELDSVQQGLAIAREADQRDSGFGGSSAQLQMHLRTGDGTEVVRQMRQKTLEVEGDGDQTIMVFDRPQDLKGAAVLTHTHKTDSDDQWLYLPALKRVKRISSSDKSGPFMGSEFAFEDLGSQEVEKYSYRYLGDELLDGEMCFVLERVPTDERSGYTRQIVWIDQSEYRLRRTDYYDRKNELLKTLTMRDYRQYLGQFWRPLQMLMHNHQTDRTTVLTFDDYRFRQGVNANEFRPNALPHVR